MVVMSASLPVPLALVIPGGALSTFAGGNKVAAMKASYA
jgi:hypothetical protein